MVNDAAKQATKDQRKLMDKAKHIARCPECNTAFHAKYIVSVVKCNTCGYRKPREA